MIPKNPDLPETATSLPPLLGVIVEIKKGTHAAEKPKPSTGAQQIPWDGEPTQSTVSRKGNSSKRTT